MYADLEDLHPDLQKELEKDDEYMQSQKSEKPVMYPPAGAEDE